MWYVGCGALLYQHSPSHAGHVGYTGTTGATWVGLLYTLARQERHEPRGLHKNDGIKPDTLIELLATNLKTNW